MAITQPKQHKAEAFLSGAPDAVRTPKLRGKRQPFALSLPPELMARIDAVAAEERRSRAKLIEVVMEDFLRERERRNAA